MKSIVLYYSMTGNCRKVASQIAKEEIGSKLYEIKEQKKRKMAGALLSGCPKALHRKPSKIIVPDIRLENYEEITIVCPIWAGFPAPAFNAIVNLLPAGRKVKLVMCSAGGEAPKSEEGTKQLIIKRGCELTEYHNVRTTPIKK